MVAYFVIGDTISIIEASWSPSCLKNISLQDLIEVSNFT